MCVSMLVCVVAYVYVCLHMYLHMYMDTYMPLLHVYVCASVCEGHKLMSDVFLNDFQL